jgi:AraC-like DNA-binding protein
MKKTVTGVLIALPIIIVLLCRLMTEEKTIDLLHDKSFDMVNFVDSTNGGRSTVNIDRKEDLTTLNLMLKEGFDYPYAGVIIYKIDRHRFSIRNYHFKLRVKANNDLRISLRFNQILQGYSSKNDCGQKLPPIPQFCAYERGGAAVGKQSGLQIAEIATAVGYNNTQHFNRVFKEFFEVSPKQYRG